VNNRFYCYIYYRKDGMTPFYIGKGSNKRAYNFSNHRHNTWAIRIINKEGKNNIKIEIIECIDEQHSFEVEKRWIAIFRADGYVLCNQTNGGEGASGFSHKHTEEVKKKMSISHIGKVISDETRKKCSLCHKNKPKTEEHKNKIAQSEKGKIVSEETKKKLSVANKGRIVSKEHKEKNRKALSGDKSNSAKLTWNIVREIRELYNTSDISRKKIAKLYNVSNSSIDHIINNLSWKE